MTLADLKRICYQPATYAQELLDRAEAAEAQRDTAWSELREIRAAIHADDNEATVDEVRRVIALLQNTLDEERRKRDELAAQLARAKTVRDEAMIPCGTCSGSGFRRSGSGYDAVCDDCTGGYIGYATGEMVNKMQDQIDNLRKQLATAQAQITELERWHYTSAEQAVESHLIHESYKRASAEYMADTPLGIALDGIGDEVDP